MSENELLLTRELDAPRDLVWKVWTDAGHLARWWGPAGFGLESADLDLRAGGRYLYSMTPPGSTTALWGVFRYDEVTPPARLVFRSGFSTPGGAFAPNPMAPVWPLQIRNELTLEELAGGRTRLTLRGSPFEATAEQTRVFAENRHQVQKGFTGTFAQLEAHLKALAEPSLTLSREVDAPVDLVWKVWTEADHLARWWGPAGSVLEVLAHSPVSGGEFRFAVPDPEGGGFRARLAYEVVTPPDTLVLRLGVVDAAGSLISFPGLEAYPREVRHTVRFIPVGTRTRIEMTLEPLGASAAELEGFRQLRDDMTRGYSDSWDRMAALAAAETRALVYRRTFAAPRPLVWKAWTTPQKIAPWWGPSGFGNTVHRMDVRPGGQWAYTMHGPDGTDYENLVSYLTVEEPSLLDYDHGDPSDPRQFHVTVRFTEVPGGTQMDYRMVFPTKAARDNAVEKYGAVEGFRQNMDRFDAWLEKTGLVVTRIFPAPRSLVWQAWTEPKRLVQWWGPEHFTCPKAEVDLRVGGRYLLGMKGPDGAEFYSGGRYLEIVSEAKLRYTDAFCDETGAEVSPASLGLPGDWPPQSVTVTFDDLGPTKTLVTVHQEQLPPEWVEMTWAGWATSFDKLDDGLVFAPEVLAYEAALPDAMASICRPLRRRIARGLAGTEAKLYHGAPVWFQGGNPVCGYSIVQDAVQLLFWSGQSFPSEGLKAAGKFRAAEARFTSEAALDAVPLDGWLAESLSFQWNYRDLPKNQGALLPLVGVGPE